MNLAALRAAKKLKDRKHLQSCANEGIVFAPILWFLTLLAAGLLNLAEVSHVISVISSVRRPDQVSVGLSLALTRCTATADMLLAIEAC